jgi:hypothetical protein
MTELSGNVPTGNDALMVEIEQLRYELSVTQSELNTSKAREEYWRKQASHYEGLYANNRPVF